MTYTQNNKSSLQKHLRELRLRIVISLAAVLCGMFLSLLRAEQIYNFCLQPLVDVWGKDTSRKLIFTGLADGFLVQLHISFVCGLVLSAPIWLSQVYFFVVPGLYKKECRIILPYLILAPCLFFLGTFFAYHFVMPQIWRFFVGFELTKSISAMPLILTAKVDEYFSSFESLVVSFGMAFQLPIVVSLLARANIVNVTKLKKYRRHFAVGIFALSALLTPPDVLSQILLAIPLLLLYEVSVLVCYVHAHSRKK
jgi:sec-independent protein translocase protein TatC